jgi:RNA polymerase sigma-70 factor, ECF subfamily
MERREPITAAEGEVSPGDETSLVLLDQAQAYLRSILQEQVPNSQLCESWSEFYRIYNELIRRYVLARQVPVSDIDDCIQEVWTAVARHLTDFEHPRDRPGLRAWLYQVVRSKTADVMRKRHKCVATSLETLIDDERDPTSSDGGVCAWRQLFLETVLAEVLTKESVENRQIMTLRLVENCSAQEIAERVGLSVRIIRYRLNSVRQRLRERFAFYSGESVDTEN